MNVLSGVVIVLGTLCVAGCDMSEPRSLQARVELTGGDTYAPIISEGALRFDLPLRVHNLGNEEIHIDYECYWILERWSEGTWSWSVGPLCASTLLTPAPFIDRITLGPKSQLEFNLSAYVNLDGSNSIGRIVSAPGAKLRLRMWVRPDGVTQNHGIDGLPSLVTSVFTLTTVQEP
jgi:hypothetical protein